jgi:hypothetical protein
MFLRKVLLGIAALSVAAIPAVLGGTAHAATGSCGHNCVDAYNKEWGAKEDLTLLADGFGRAGQTIGLSRASNANIAEDFVYSDEGSVASLASLGYFSRGVLVHYSRDEAFELMYEPAGLDVNLCVGTAAYAPRAGNLLVLEPCGESARTLWIVAPAKGRTHKFVNVIAGTTTNFSHPLVWTYPGWATPFDYPRPAIELYPLLTNSRGFSPDYQQWSAKFGVLDT